MPDELQDIDTLYDSADAHSRDRSGKPADSSVPALVIQSHQQLDRVGEICWMTGLLEGKSVALGRNFPDFHRADSLIGTPLADPHISRSPIHLKRLASGAIELNCTDSRIHLTVNGEPVEESIKLTAEQLSHGMVIELGSRITLLLKSMQPAVRASATSSTMVGVSPQLQSVLERLQHLKGMDEPVLIRGPSGAGKELLAQAVHEGSNRVDQPFIRVNLATISSSIAAAELFGVKKGAFTGADQDRSGFFVAAQGGTLFLDEIGEASAEVQSMLLHVLESGELYRVGSNTPQQVNVRIIAATDANLVQLSEAKKFQQSLLHRLASHEIVLPPLHERREDIGPLYLHFCKQQFSELEQRDPLTLPYTRTALMPNELVCLLLNYHWPGNIRQLRNIARQLVIDNRDRHEISISEQIRDQLSDIRDAQLYRSLEERVMERTRALQQSNRELEKARAQAEAANRAKSQFLASMSHELRTPLNAVIGYSEMLQEEVEDLGQKDLLPDLKRIHAAGKHLLALINDILDLSKIEAGKMELFLEDFDVADMVQDSVAIVSPLVAKNTNTLEVHCADHLGTMRADLTKVRQVLFNLLSNACKFTEKGTIALHVAREEADGRDWIRFRVSDNGIGMNPQQVGKLFQAFTQADVSTTRKYGGTGLGLAISQRFCQMIGGEISVQSELGRGSTFTARLPAKVIASDG